MRILDMDMDYFMNEIASTPFSVTERLSEDVYGESVWNEKSVRDFLENNLGLSKTHKIPGRIVEGHDEALYFWEELVEKGLLTTPFEVVHVDSHADLGLGTGTASFLQGEFLELPIEIRRKIKNYELAGKLEEINIGDYLLWAIGYQMISEIIYCANPNGEKNDYCWETLKNFKDNYIAGDEPIKNVIQLKYNRNMELPYFGYSKKYIQDYLHGCRKDPEVNLLILPTIESVKFNGDFDYVTMAQSPNYTPPSADYILNLVREYIQEI